MLRGAPLERPAVQKTATQVLVEQQEELLALVLVLVFLQERLARRHQRQCPATGRIDANLRQHQKALMVEQESLVTLPAAMEPPLAEELTARFGEEYI